MKEEKMRITSHNGRAGKDGAYSPKHNDRNFDTETAEHINEEKSPGNRYWSCIGGVSFEECEQRMYEVMFAKSLAEKNERYRKQRHPERMQTMQQYRENPRSCPEETILQIGRDGQTVDSDLLWKIVREHIQWEVKTFPNVVLLDLALHVDEDGAPHIHERKVWIGHDENGNEVVGQSKALAEMGIEPPYPNKKYGKHNNAKMTYTRLCREHFAEVCQKYELDLELTPREASKSGLNLLEYQRRQEMEKLSQARTEQETLKEENIKLSQRISDLEASMMMAQSNLREVKEKSREAQKSLEKAQRQIEKLSSSGSEELAGLNAQISAAGAELKQILDMKARASEIHRIFGDRETQTYHKNMLESTRAIGDEAWRHLKKATEKEQDIARREAVVEKKSKSIEPLYNKLRKQERDQDQLIQERAWELAEEKFQDFMEEHYGYAQDGRSERLESFCDSFTLKDGRTLLEAFNEQEEQRVQALRHSWSYDR